MKKSTILAALVSMAFTPFVGATTVGFSPVPTARAFTTSTGSLLSTSSLVLVGNFLNESFAFNSSITVLQNYNAIVAQGGWKEFTADTATGDPNTGVTRTYAINSTGKLGGQGTDNNSGATKADYFNGRAVYVWIFSASTIAASTEMGIFKAAATIPWVFPANANGVGDTVTLSTTAAGATIASVGGAGNASLNLSEAVPEPSTAFLSALGMLAMASRRRRNRN